MQMPLAALSLAATLSLAACNLSGIDMTDSSPSPPRASPVRAERPAYRRNPNPTQAYRITMRIEDAPGPFAHMLGLAQFDVVNPECLPPPNDNPGGYTSPIPTVGIEIPLHQVADNEYAGIVHADQMLDEDYHGRGTCRWALIQAQVQLRATGTRAETRFIASLDGEQIRRTAEQPRVFWKGQYPGEGLGPEGRADYPYFGDRDRSQLRADIPDADLFRVLLSSRREDR